MFPVYSDNAYVVSYMVVGNPQRTGSNPISTLLDNHAGAQGRSL